MKRFLLTTAAITCAAAALAACDNTTTLGGSGSGGGASSTASTGAGAGNPLGAADKVDLLLVVDNSRSMADKQLFLSCLLYTSPSPRD